MNFLKNIALGLITCFASATFAATDPRMTRDIIIDIDTTLTTCCDNIQKDFENTWTILGVLGAPSCRATPITSAITISQSGYYCLANDIIGVITITASDVVLDLNYHTIAGGLYGVEIGSGSNRVIANGTIRNTSGAGIHVGATTEATFISNISLVDCSNTVLDAAITITGSSTGGKIQGISIDSSYAGVLLGGTISHFVIKDILINPVTTFGMSFTSVGDTIINGVSMNQTQTGIYISDCTRMQLNDIQIFQTQDGVDCVGFNSELNFSKAIINECSQGFSFNVIQDSKVIDCAVQGCFNPDAANGFLDIGGIGNEFDNCSVSVIQSSSHTTGFAVLTGFDQIFRNCSVQGAFSNVAGSVIAYNIFLAGQIVLQECKAIDTVSTGGDARGYSLDSSGDIDVIDSICIGAKSSVAANGSGFFISGGLTNSIISQCQAIDSSDSGFFIELGARCLVERCQSVGNAGNGFTINSILSQVENCTAFSNTGTGFNSVSSSVKVFHCSATNNTAANFSATTPYVNNAIDQVNPAVLAPNGPFAGSNIFA